MQIKIILIPFVILSVKYAYVYSVLTLSTTFTSNLYDPSSEGYLGLMVKILYWLSKVMKDGKVISVTLSVGLIC